MTSADDTPAATLALPAGSRSEMPDVLIVGAGPTGLMAAAFLIRCGTSVRIVDKSPTAAKESRAFGIQARSMELFAQLGLAETLLDRGLLATGAQIYVSGKRAAELNFDDIGRMDTPFQFLLMVPQSDIEEVLVEDLRQHGLTVERGVEVIGHSQTSESVTVQANASGNVVELHGRYLIGADGAHSFIRKALGLTFEGAAYPYTFLLADCCVEWPFSYDHFTLLIHERGLGIFLPLKGQSVARVMAIDPSVPTDDPSLASQGSSPVSLEEVETAFRRATKVDVKFSNAIWTTRYRVHHRGVNRYSLGRSFVAGDAAHIHSPAGGQGMNTGLQDVANLAWKLSLVLKRQAPAELLETYHSERWPVGEKVLKYTDKVFGTMTSQTGWIAGLRSLLLPVVAATVSHVEMARSRAFHFISQLGIRYHASIVAQDETSGKAQWSFREGLTAGHRAPNAAISRNHDVFELFAGYHFTLLALSRTPLSNDEIARLSAALDALKASTSLDIKAHVIGHSLIGRDERLLRAESGAVFEVYGLKGDTLQAIYLIRPDGYIAWRTDSLDIESCRRFLTRTFKP